MSTRLHRFITDVHPCDKSVTVAEADVCRNSPCRARGHHRLALHCSAAASGRFRYAAENKERRRASWRALVSQSRSCGFCRRRVPRRIVLDSIGATAHVLAGLSARRTPSCYRPVPQVAGRARPLPQRGAAAAEQVQRQRKTATDNMDRPNGATVAIYDAGLSGMKAVYLGVNCCGCGSSGCVRHPSSLTATSTTATC